MPRLDVSTQSTQLICMQTHIIIIIVISATDTASSSNVSTVHLYDTLLSHCKARKKRVLFIQKGTVLDSLSHFTQWQKSSSWFRGRPCDISDTWWHMILHQNYNTKQRLNCPHDFNPHYSTVALQKWQMLSPEELRVWLKTSVPVSAERKINGKWLLIL